jgi:hypothetical protein
VKRFLPLLLLAVLGGCVYYNGVYNAKRLAGRARKAEREGRTFDASGLWGQVAVKAESVLVRHPTSKYADEARVLQGTALVRMRNCPAALPGLEAVLAAGREQELVEQAAILVGGCRSAMGDPLSAMSAYGRLTASRDSGRRNLALFAHGRALRVSGDYQAALDELGRSSHPEAQGERAAALAGLGRLPQALAIADSLIARRDTLAPWDSLVAAVARRDPAAASDLTDRVVSAELQVPLEARLLIADAMRLRLADSARSEARLKTAERLGEGSVLGAEARLNAVLIRLAAAEEIPALEAQALQLEELGERAGPVAPRAAQLAAVVRRTALAADSTPAGTPRGDLRLFVAAEMARDSLGADRFAARQFRRVATEWSDSPFAPKALLALVLLEPAHGDSLREVLLQRYSGSPYVALVEGGQVPEFEVLEDSLRRFAVGFRPEGRGGIQPIRPARPQGSPREPVNR